MVSEIWDIVNDFIVPALVSGAAEDVVRTRHDGEIFSQTDGHLRHYLPRFLYTQYKETESKYFQENIIEKSPHKHQPQNRDTPIVDGLLLSSRMQS